MDDPRFSRSVVLVLKHDENGAMGVILNRPVDDSFDISDKLSGLFTEIRSAAVHGTSVCVGGPVAGPLIALRRPSVRGGSGGVYLIEGSAELRQLTKQVDGPLQFFVGHAGWAASQLEDELASGCWLTLPASAEFLDSDHREMWSMALRASGRSIYRDILGIRGFPEDASLN